MHVLCPTVRGVRLTINGILCVIFETVFYTLKNSVGIEIFTYNKILAFVLYGTNNTIFEIVYYNWKRNGGLRMTRFKAGLLGASIIYAARK